MSSYPSEPGTDPSFMSLAGDALRCIEGRPVLMGGRCEECQALSFPRAMVCADCMSDLVTPAPMSERGVLYTWTKLHVGSRRMKRPVTLGYIDLQNGIRVFSCIESGGRSLAFGQPMRLDVAQVGTEENGEPIRTFVFTPEDEK